MVGTPADGKCAMLQAMSRSICDEGEQVKDRKRKGRELLVFETWYSERLLMKTRAMLDATQLLRFRKRYEGQQENDRRRGVDG